MFYEDEDGEFYDDEGTDFFGQLDDGKLYSQMLL